ncbi:hypothetical protein [Streptomyces tubercidicus]|uniref:hypothetical protein n=1 Tax=Streptomyces tubercidicus TaxID=47759 RepID=UPI002E0EF524|nr:hypothetical protein OG761_15265 [Streptomyces tubercidicus]WSX22183.1 hypothetical protein OG690_21700 [Streptomyces tubercidicus]
MQRHEYTGPVALRAMQNLTGRLFPDSGYRHIGDLAWAWCLALDRADDNPTAVWTDGGKAAPAALPPASGRPRRGLARAVCLAALRAFAAAGGRRAVVYCRGDAGHPVPKRLYESLGFTAYTRTHTYV